jgi:hypothetical protein
MVKSTLKMEEIFSSETLPLIDQIIMPHCPEENSLLIYNFIDVSEEGTASLFQVEKLQCSHR